MASSCSGLCSLTLLLDANSLTQTQVELFKGPNIMFMFSLCLASVQEKKVNHSLVYFDLKFSIIPFLEVVYQTKFLSHCS